MIWPPNKIEQIERMYRTMTAKEMAAHFGISHENMRYILHQHDIKDPKNKAHQRRDIICRLWNRGSVHDLAEYIGTDVRTVRRHAKRLGLVERTGQVCAFPMTPDAQAVSKPTTKRVNIRRQRYTIPQPELFTQTAA